MTTTSGPIERLREVLGFDPAELRGARVSGEVPIPDALLNRLIAEQLAARTAPVTDLVLAPLDGDAIDAHVRLRTAFVPALRVHLRIESQPSFPDSPVLTLRWSLGALGGALSRFAGPALAFLNVLPPGIRMDGDLIAVDLAALMKSRGLGELLPWVARLRLTTQSGRVVVAFELRNRA
jgi:hypothetical protein